MSNFKNALARVLKNEGGYVNNPNDRGGETYKGVARKFHPNWAGWSILDTLSDKNSSNVLLDEAIELFYLENFWNKLKCDGITSDEVAFELFDTCVNMGVSGGAKLMQLVVEVTADGVIGVQTLGAINALDEELLLLRLKLTKVARRVHLVEKRPQNRAFLLGWIRRDLGA